MLAAQTTPLDIATALVALYAAIVASLTFVFQVFSWLRTWQTRVEVEVRRMQMMQPGQPAVSAVVFQLVNHSGHVVKISSVSLAPLKKGGMHALLSQPFPLLVPGSFEIPARDSFTVWVYPDAFDGYAYDLDHKTRALIGTSDRGKFKSKKVRVRDLLKPAELDRRLR